MTKKTGRVVKSIHTANNNQIIKKNYLNYEFMSEIGKLVYDLYP